MRAGDKGLNGRVTAKNTGPGDPSEEAPSVVTLIYAVSKEKGHIWSKPCKRNIRSHLKVDHPLRHVGMNH